MAREEFDIYNYVHKNKFNLKVEEPAHATKVAKAYNDIRKTNINEIKIVDGKFSLSESLSSNTDRPFATEVKKHFLEIISTYTSFHEQMKRNSDIVETADTLGGVIEAAKTLTLKEAGDWFDKVTLGRHSKKLGESLKLFEKTAKEMTQLQQRLESVYEEIGETLGKYYEIKSKDE